MKWQTKEEIQKAAQGTELEATEKSLIHWQQLKDCSYEDFMDGRSNYKVDPWAGFCAICIKHIDGDGNAKCGECPLPDCQNPNTVWATAKELFHLANNRSDVAKFQDAAAAMCKVIEKAIDEIKAKNLIDAMLEAKAELEKAKKPELRHGDYGYDTNGDACIYINVHMKGLRECCDEHLWLNARGYVGIAVTILGNIFDDLKLNSKDLGEVRVEFDKKGNKVFMDLNVENKIWIHFCGYDQDGVYVPIDKAVDFHQKLGQIIATAKRKQK